MRIIAASALSAAALFVTGGIANAQVVDTLNTPAGPITQGANVPVPSSLPPGTGATLQNQTSVGTDPVFSSDTGAELQSDSVPVSSTGGDLAAYNPSGALPGVPATGFSNSVTADENG